MGGLFDEPKVVTPPPVPSPPPIPSPEAEVIGEAADVERRQQFRRRKRGKAGTVITGELTPEFTGKKALLG